MDEDKKIWEKLKIGNIVEISEQFNSSQLIKQKELQELQKYLQDPNKGRSEILELTSQQRFKNHCSNLLEIHEYQTENSSYRRIMIQKVRNG